jgi:hypothetical protein
MSREGMRLDLIRALLRNAATLDRLACAQCNGDYPADNGQRKVDACSECGGLWVPLVLKQFTPKGGPLGGIFQKCPDCRTADRVRALLTGSGWMPVFGGDPRGCVLKVARECICHKSCGGCGITTYAESPANPECLKHGTQGKAAIDNGRAESRGDVIGVPS